MLCKEENLKGGKYYEIVRSVRIKRNQIMLIKRLFRRIKWLLLYQWKSLALKQWPYESCKKCGKAFRIIWSVENKYWYLVMNRKDSGGGSLCIDCFLELADNKNIKISKESIYVEVFEYN